MSERSRRPSWSLDAQEAEPISDVLSQQALQRAREGQHPYSPAVTDFTTLPDGGNFGTKWTNLPPDMTYPMLFDSMRGIGAISHAYISMDPYSARVEFTEVAAAMRLLQTRITIAGQEISIVPDGGRYLTQSNAVHQICGNWGRGSRVLRIVGNRMIIRAEFLLDILTEARYRLNHCVIGSATSTDSHGLATVLLHFTSFACAALPARQAFLEQRYRTDILPHKRVLWEYVTCYYERDPCE